MEEEIKIQKPKNGRKGRKKSKLEPSQAPAEIKNQNIHEDESPHQQDVHQSSCRWSSEVIEPALKTMNFRKKRGTRMKDLLKGKPRKDHFWEKYQDYFGGDLNKPDDSEEEEDYQASSSGRDQFDSDFDLTDSYIGKRGRKKGTKIKKRKRGVPKTKEEKPQGQPKVKGKRGRKKKNPVELPPVQKSEILLKEEKCQEEQANIKEEILINPEEIKQCIEQVSDLKQVQKVDFLAQKQSGKQFCEEKPRPCEQQKKPQILDEKEVEAEKSID